MPPPQYLLTPIRPDDISLHTLFPPQHTQEETTLGPSGRRVSSRFYQDGTLLGEVRWSTDGTWPQSAALIQGTSPSGWRLEFHPGSERLSLAEPLLNGQVHGTMTQWDHEGVLLVACSFVHGTGVEYLCCRETGALVEEHPMVNGQPHGPERWWCVDRPAVYAEVYWQAGKRHGPARRWEADGTLAAGYPQLYVRGQRVSQDAYTNAVAQDPTLPPLRTGDDEPARRLPADVVRQLGSGHPEE